MAVSIADMLALVRELPIPVPWDREVFVENLAETRGRAIRLIPTDTAALADSPCGLWLACDNEDLILHEVGTTEYHIDQIVGHEIGHILLAHGKSGRHGIDTTRNREACRRVLPDIDFDAVRAVLGRSDYANYEERDAEMFASLLIIAAGEAAERRSMMRSAFFRRQ